MRGTLRLNILLLIQGLAAQQIGSLTPEVHPSLPSEICSKSGGCKTAKTSIVLDSNFRYLHEVGGYTNCVTQSFNQSICTDAESCVKKCALEGADYSTYGLKTEQSAVTMNLFVKKSTGINKASPRIYLYDEEKSQYAMFKLLNQEFTFDVDMSKTGCGVNGALYFSEMHPTGHKDDINVAGAKYGTGYCDAQCPKQNYIRGRANFKGTGACCNEMDIWEANNAATSFTPHPCNITGVYECTDPLCGNKNRLDSVCDRDGCDFNGFRNGAKSFYGRGKDKTVDSSRPFTVVTQFITSDGTSAGSLIEVKRLYVQDGKVIPEATVSVKGLESGNSLTDKYCNAQKQLFGAGNPANAFKTQGGLKEMGEALRRGMVLAMAIWDDAGGSMHWLDSTVPETANPTTPGVMRGPCPVTGGSPAQIQSEQPDASVVFSKIRSGDIGSTYKA